MFTDPKRYALDLESYGAAQGETRLMALSRAMNQYPQVPRSFWIAVLDAWVAQDLGGEA